MMMPYRRLLVFQDDSPHCAQWTRQATELASVWQAQLLALHVEPRIHVTHYADAAISEGLEQAQRTLERNRNNLIRDRFEAEVAKAGVSAVWTAELGDPVVEMRRMARYADLAVLGIAADRSADMNELSRVAEHVAVGSGCPALLLPEAFAGKVSMDRVALCWDGSREAARALRDALPLLKSSSEVHILFAEEEAEAHPGLRGELLCEHLRAHGVTPQLHSIAAKHSGAGRPLLERAEVLGADLIVLGAYGHMRLRDLVLGGVTRHMLRHSGIPIFMAH